jgi:hypothetical protein
VLTDAALNRRMQAAARESVLKYGWQRIADEHLALYAEVRNARRTAVAAR